MNVIPFESTEQPQSSDKTISEKLANLHNEMASLRLECDRLINKHLLVEKTLSEGCVLCPNPDTSSAYNTGGESCRSNSITPDGTAKAPQTPAPNDLATMAMPPRLPRLLHRSKNMLSPSNVDEEIRLDSRPSLLGSEIKSYGLTPTESANCLHTPGYADDVHISSSSTPKSDIRRFPPLRLIPRQTRDDCAKRFKVPSLSIVMRGQGDRNRSLEALAQPNIPMPKYFRSTKVKNKLYLLEEPVEKPNETQDDREVAGPSVRNFEPIPYSNDSIVYKWKVKRRCDGSRYIVKRPARNQILKKRAAQLVRERTGVSTDDDALSELKLGHFHSREERKKHLEEERRRKIKHQQKIIESKISPADQMIMQLSQRKMQRQKEKMLLDGFVTTQEVLSQRNPDPTAKHGILSVTTV
ncbi:hypothetical protein KIN20_012751 [Parelaphostrongylus tenuis]|uniref:Uncharacterized protein n=1 Tax=Parelaphostrongylus tenuis TaxID=148309 RepID=A0AAD5MV40_PARTN|nr:hypothetical protein KIN20_012751 [Parelaphostrongylus tenuis]